MCKEKLNLKKINKFTLESNWIFKKLSLNAVKSIWKLIDDDKPFKVSAVIVNGNTDEGGKLFKLNVCLRVNIPLFSI